MLSQSYVAIWRHYGTMSSFTVHGEVDRQSTKGVISQSILYEFPGAASRKTDTNTQ